MNDSILEIKRKQHKPQEIPSEQDSSDEDMIEVSAADKGCRVYPLDPRTGAVALYSGWTPGKHRAWFLLDDLHIASLVGLRGGWRHARTNYFCAYGLKSAVPGVVIPEPDLLTTPDAEILDGFSDQGVIQADENITKIKYPPLNLLPSLSSPPQPNASQCSPAVTTSSSTQAQLLPSISSIASILPDPQPPTPVSDAKEKTKEQPSQAHGPRKDGKKTDLKHCSPTPYLVARCSRVRIPSTSLITVCCLYLPPNAVIHQQDMYNLVDQLPAPFVILGDFNGHSTLWGSGKTNSRGRQIEQVFSDHCLCLLNHEEPTYFHEPTRSFHTLDLAICSPSLVPNLNFSVEKDLYNSDHFPVVLSHDCDAFEKTFPPSYFYNRADWALFTRLAVIPGAIGKTESVDIAIQEVPNVLIAAADLSILKNSGRSFQPW
ncbi:putative RNA-directed DNA polymerase from transposon X-element [Trichonephila clavipes]|nr:putative RNA-directed DNA polymerase from transposon X-element [Trichonephila clavipes]